MIRSRGNLSKWDRKNFQFLEKTIEEVERKIATGECKENKNNQIVDDKISKSDNNHDITSDNGDIIENVVIESGTLNNESGGNNDDTLANKADSLNSKQVTVDKEC